MELDEEIKVVCEKVAKFGANEKTPKKTRAMIARWIRFGLKIRLHVSEKLATSQTSEMIEKMEIGISPDQMTLDSITPCDESEGENRE